MKETFNLWAVGLYIITLIGLLVLIEAEQRRKNKEKPKR